MYMPFQVNGAEPTKAVALAALADATNP